jgi:hypothetical protein
MEISRKIYKHIVDMLTEEGLSAEKAINISDKICEELEKTPIQPTTNINTHQPINTQPQSTPTGRGYYSKTRGKFVPTGREVSVSPEVFKNA